jgi:hypothetical protein
MSSNGKGGKGATNLDSLDCLCALLEELEDLVELCCEEVESSHNPSVRSKVVPASTKQRKAGKRSVSSELIPSASSCFLPSSFPSAR